MADPVSTLTAHPHVAAAEERLLHIAPGPVAHHTICPVQDLPADLETARSWGMLAARWGTSPFLFPSWIDTWVTWYQPQSRIEIFDARAGEQVIGALPLLRESTWLCGVPVRRLRPPYSLTSPDPYELQTVPGGQDLAAEAIWNHLRRDRSWDVIELVDLAAGSSAAALIAQAEASGFVTGRRPSRVTPWVDLTTITDPFAHTTAKFRANLRRRRRNLEQLGNLQLVRHTDLSSDVVNQFLELEHAGWKGRNGTSILSSATDTMYHCAIARVAAEAGHLAIYSLEFDGKPIAMHFGVIAQNRYSVPKLAFDEQFHEYAPGHILVHDVLQDLIARDIAEFDFLGNQMDWKREWTPLTRSCERVHIFNRTTCGLAAAGMRYNLLPRARAVRNRLAAVQPEHGS